MRMVRRRFTVGALAVMLAVPVGITAAPSKALPPPAPAPDESAWSPEAKAMAAARRNGERVELTSLRTETGEVFANPDGTKTMEQHARPVRVRKGRDWVTADATLRRMPDGSVEPVAAIVPLRLSGGGSTELLSFGKPGARVHLGWPGKLPVPRINGNTATYEGVLPGVDLRIKADVDQFSHLLVVKNHAAALNPALRTLHYPVRGEGLTVTVRKDGTTAAVDRDGKAVYTAPAPMMWESGLKRHARLGLQAGKGAMTLTPDTRLLTDPAAEFPLYIDPSLSGSLVNWLHVNVRMGGQNAWFYDRNDEGAKVGRAYGDTANLYRSMFLMNTTNGAATIAGSTITGATFRITLNKSPSGTPTPVQLWHLNDLVNGNYVDWGNQEGYWRGVVDTRNGEAYPFTEDNPMEFSTDALKNVIQDVANGRRPTVSLGLRAPDENNQWQWKKFHPNTAVLAISYNTKPRMPKSLNFTRPRPCGTAAAPTQIATKTPQFSAVGNDPDIGDNITTTLQILDTAGNVVHSSQVGPTVTGAAFSWPEVPAGRLADNVTYRYRAYTNDSVESGPSTPDCYFVVDTIKPAPPLIESADYPEGEPMIPARTVGRVTFRPGAGNTDVYEYVYGLQRDKLTMRVRAGSDGSATVPIIIHPNPAPSAMLYVRAVDKAGNPNLDPPTGPVSLDMQALDPVGPQTFVRGDSNGDGRADVTAVFDHGFGRTAVWNVAAGGGSTFHTGVMAWDTGEGGGFALSRTKPVQGDWDHDGRTDMAMFREGAGRQIWLYRLNSDGNRYNAPPAVWTSGPNGWPLSTARTFAGDVDGDLKADIVVQNAGTADNWQALVFRAANNFATPATWVQAGGGNPWSASAPLLADIDGDNKDDLLSMRNLAGCRTVIDMYRSTGTAFAAATTIYDSGAGNHCWEKSKPTVADPDGDGRDDIVTLYENGPTDASLFVFRSNGTALTRSEWRRTSGLDLSKATLAAGDYDGDTKEDVAVVYAGGQIGDRQVYTFHSTGTAFDDKLLGWGGQVGAVTGPKFDIEHRQYELIAKHSGRCLNVSGQSYENLARYIQWQCLPVDLNARFRLMPVAGTDQYSVRPAHTAQQGGTKCADIGGWSLEDGGQLLQWPCGNGNGEPTANQQITIEYVDGSAFDTVVQLRFAHSGKCATVEGAGLQDGAFVVQQTCGQLTNQQWILRPAFNSTQLGNNGAARYRTEAATTNTKVLDVTDCQDNDGGQVRMWDWVTGSPCQKWQLESLGDDVYKIVDPDNGKVLDISGCSKLPRGTIHIWTSNESECQKWRIEPTWDGSYSIIAVSTGLSMDVAGCSAAAGAEVITWFYHGGPCQRWFFRPQ